MDCLSKTAPVMGWDVLNSKCLEVGKWWKQEKQESVRI